MRFFLERTRIFLEGTRFFFFFFFFFSRRNENISQRNEIVFSNKREYFVKEREYFSKERDLFLKQTRIFLEGSRFFLEQTRIFLDGTRIFLEGTRKPLLTYNGENDVSNFRLLFLIRYFLYLQVTRTCIKFRTSSNFGQIGPLTTELAALEV